MKNIEEILNYIFKLINQSECTAFELRMDNDPEFGKLVDGVLDYCMENNLTTKEAFYKKMDELKVQRDDLLAKLNIM